MNCLARKIGIWYNDRFWAEDLFEDIVKNIPPEAIARMVTNRSGEMFVVLKDETFIKFIKASDCGKGQCFSESYVQEGMSYDLVNYIVSPCTKIGSMEVYVINKYQDLFRPTKYRNYIKSELEKKE